MNQMLRRFQYSRRLLITVTTVFFTLSLSLKLNADTLGRLFTTPQQRALIDQYKNKSTIVDKVDERIFTQPITEQEAKPDESAVVYNGVVKRSSGKTAVWVNGVLVDSGRTQKDQLSSKVVRDISQDNSVIVKPAGTKTLVKLKPGQKWTPGSHAITDPHQSINVRRPFKNKHRIKIIKNPQKR